MPNELYLYKIDNDFIILRADNGRLFWAHKSALKTDFEKNKLVTITWYENLYSRAIEAIK